MRFLRNALLCAYFLFAQYGAKLLAVQLHGRSIVRTYPFPVQGDEFKAKRVLVTGGTKGMGAAVVRRLTLGGASVATTARSPLADGQSAALFLQADIGTAEGVRSVVDRVQREWGGLDILVNNVGG